MSITEHNKKLKEVFKYSEADLLMNRQEKVSESQGATLKSYRKGRMTSLIAFVVMFVLIGLVVLGVGIWILVKPGENVIRLAILGAMGFMMLMIAISSLNFYIQSGDILSGKVRQRQGTAQLYTRQYRDEYRSLGLGWFVKLDKKEFGLKTAEQYAALEEGAAYRIYYIKGYRSIYSWPLRRFEHRQSGIGIELKNPAKRPDSRLNLGTGCCTITKRNSHKVYTNCNICHGGD